MTTFMGFRGDADEYHCARQPGGVSLRDLRRRLRGRLRSVQAHPGQISFVHTETDPAFSGRGLAKQLVTAALDDVRSRGLAVLPFCPYVKKFIAENPDYLDLVPAAQRGRFGLTQQRVGD